MINKAKQRLLLHLFDQELLRVTPAGVVEQYVASHAEWRPVYTRSKGEGYGPLFRRNINGVAHEFPVSAAALLWRVRYVLPEDVYVDYLDGNPENLSPDNLSMMSPADFRRWMRSRRTIKQE